MADGDMGAHRDAVAHGDEETLFRYGANIISLYR